MPLTTDGTGPERYRSFDTFLRLRWPRSFHDRAHLIVGICFTVGALILIFVH